MFSTIIEALDYDHSKGIHQRMVQEANAEKFKLEFFNLSMCSSVSIDHLSELKELKI
jgi:hypothetical protein